MYGTESFARKQAPREVRNEIELASIDDFSDMPQIQSMLRRLPRELQGMHATKIIDMSEEDAFAYLLNISEKRETATRDSQVSDRELAPYFKEHEAEILKDLETRVLQDPNNFLGAGQTARIKKYQISDRRTGTVVPMAIKYLLTPTAKTLSVSGEHDLLMEVERVRAIEEAELSLYEKELRIKVPHPYFYHKHEKIQCYGMELINGVNLEEAITGKWNPELCEKIRAAFAGVDRNEIALEVDAFFDAMHSICLHGDIKPANLMVSDTGQLYVIDFGQSVLTNDVPEKAREAFETLKEDEKEGTKRAINLMLNALGL
jgi:tRNA A-37 threonylcarbamoyl transferase component Bud32